MKMTLEKPDLARAMAIDNPGEAEAFIETYASYLVEESRSEENKPPLLTPEAADELARHNVAYHAAIYSHMNLARVEELFSAKHPVYQSEIRDQRSEVKGTEPGPEVSGQSSVVSGTAPEEPVKRKRARTEDVLPAKETEHLTQPSPQSGEGVTTNS